jgi:hypothetical protein
MKAFLISMAAVSALAVAAPAAAQYQTGNGYQDGYGNGDGYRNNAGSHANISARIGQLETRLQAGVRSGAISRQEAVPLRRQLRQLGQLERQYAVNGLNGRERSDLQQRVGTLRQQIRTADGGNQARWNVYDREDRWGQYDRADAYGSNDRMDRNNDGYDDRDYDRDGRWDDDDRNGDGRWDDSDRNGDYQQPARSGLGGVVDAIMGSGGLRVGQHASADLYGVPNEYRSQYRDGNGVYYRSDGRQIYQIDARTQTVARVYPMNR